ncbi:hypothetical protein D0869_12105 [Hortaea werneckii]|uniref:UBL3-like ubiquitin domain-containing protein n=1 Tax=Hortaea werneckii TaxID=91943 RepID=A0A3M6XXJ2_HORWE|nr:hypothetical protein KC316_g3662 [Hortaea werneckii]RMX74926.1 hypothetical protein D0869_12105 [Hortaea werneckii]RMX95515.1 hypothetical protein D0868_11689 [Hortaea werneckii]
MASQEAEPAATTAPSSTPGPADHHPPSTSPPPVEMDALPSNEQDKSPETQHTEQSATTTSSPAPPQQPSHPDSTQPDTAAAATTTTTNPPPSQLQQDPSSHTRKPSEALGPATENAIPNPTSPTSPTGPVLLITLMLTTGQRHPYKIDEKYLANRNTTTKTGEGGEFDPLSLSGYKLKELIWTDWRSEWEPRPAAPGSIRLIIYGKMVEDKKSLSDYNFNLATNNILHMTVKPADFGDDDDQAGTAKQGHKSSGLGRRHRRQGDAGDEDGGGGAGCRCVIL